MSRANLVVVTDRGGHLQNAIQLVAQMKMVPDAVVTTRGPEVSSLGLAFPRVLLLPYLFSWFGKKRRWNPFKAALQFVLAFAYVCRLRPKHVISLGASDVIFFCYLSKLMGAGTQRTR